VARHIYACPMRWSDMDVFGHVNNVNFLRYLEEARIDFTFTTAGEVGEKAFSEGSVVARHEIDYLIPLVYHPEPVTIETWITKLGRHGQGVRTGQHGLRALRPGGGASASADAGRARLPGRVPGNRDGRGMSTAVEPLRFAEPREVGPLADFLTRLLRYDRAAAVRLQTAGATLAVFARIPLGESGPLVIRTARLAQAHPLDVTVSAGQWLEELARQPQQSGAESDTPAGGEDEGRGEGALVLPPSITGPAWAGVLPPRSGWEHVADLPTEPLAAAVAAAVAEFRRVGESDASGSESAGGDALAEAIWSRRVHPSGLTLRALHAAHLTGLLRQAPQLALHQHPAWLRLTAPRGSVIIRRASTPGAGLGLSFSPSPGSRSPR
jgi:hypothetical protein